MPIGAKAWDQRSPERALIPRPWIEDRIRVTFRIGWGACDLRVGANAIFYQTGRAVSGATCSTISALWTWRSHQATSTTSA